MISQNYLAMISLTHVGYFWLLLCLTVIQLDVIYPIPPYGLIMMTQIGVPYKNLFKWRLVTNLLLEVNRLFSTTFMNMKVFPSASLCYWIFSTEINIFISCIYISLGLDIFQTMKSESWL